LHVVHALDPLLAAATQTRHIDLVAGTRDALGEFRRGIPLAEGAAAIVHAVTGPAAEAICDTASTPGADLIVAGSRGLTGLNRLMMGTTLERVIGRSQVSVLAVTELRGEPRHRPRHGPGLGLSVVGAAFRRPNH
jgi:nucleotide-binding universal stress UspA family protein